MRLDTRAFALAAGIVAAVLWTVCTFLLTVMPQASMAAFSSMTHIELGGLARKPTWSTFLIGLGCWFILTFLIYWCVAGIYNRLLAEPDARLRK